MASAKRTAEPKTTTTPSKRSTAKAKPTPAPTAPTAEQVQRRAYEIWRSRGGMGGSPEDDWAQAERELRLELTPPSW